MKMRVMKIMLITLVMCSLSVMSLSCASESDSESETKTQVVTVQRGDLTIDITASGNLALSLQEDLAFDIPGKVQEITVEEILVEEGESVEEGQMLAKLDTSEWDDALTALERDLLQAEINLENAELALEKAEEETTTSIAGDIVIGRTTDPKEIDIKELQVELAEARFEDARKMLKEALEKSPEIIAPFDGFITRVNVDGGDEVRTGTVAVQLADPNKFEADVFVSEMDILQIKLGGDAWVQVDAMQGMSLPAEVTHISPTATIQSGVVNYKVKVEIQSLEATMREGQQAKQEAMEKIAQGELPERLKQAIEEGRITQEQAEEMLKQIQQGQGAQQRQTTSMMHEDFQLREGLTVTVSILVDERNDVLLVPNSAITRQGQETFVQVSKDGVIEERSIKTGISDWQYTEVTDGLSEGEQVLVPQGTAITPATQQQRPPGGGMLIPGVRPHR